MPRQTAADYLKTHRWLAKLWAEQQDSFGFLGYQEQMYLHDYFAPSQGISDEELVAHRKAVTARRPSLPQCAGRALRRLQVELEAAAAVRVPAGSSHPAGNRRIVVRAIARPEVDEDRMVQALLRAARDLVDEDHDNAA